MLTCIYRKYFPRNKVFCMFAGSLDKPTIWMMEQPRCGKPDLERPMDDVKRRKRYALFGKPFLTLFCSSNGVLNGTPS